MVYRIYGAPAVEPAQPAPEPAATEPKPADTTAPESNEEN